jgi:tetratricopeptide (TPR) repeat protein
MKIKFLKFIVFVYILFSFFALSFASNFNNLKKENVKLILEGDLAFNKNDYKKARLYYFKALKAIKNNKNKKYRAIIFNKIADTYVDKKDKIESIAILKQSILENTYNEETYLKLAEIYKILDIEKAEDMYKEAYKINQDNEITNFNLGLFAENRLDYEEATQYYENVLKIKINDFDTSFRLASLYFKIGKMQNAIDIIADIKSPYLNYKFYVLLGDIYYRKTMYIEAVNEYEQALILAPDNKYIYLCLYLTLRKLNKFNESEKIKIKANELGINNNDFNDAIKAFDKCQKISIK